MNREESNAWNTAPDQVSSSTFETGISGLSTQNSKLLEIQRAVPYRSRQKRVSVRRTFEKCPWVLDSFLGTVNAASRTTQWRLKEVSDQPETQKEYQNDYEVSYIVRPAPWLLRLGFQYGLNIKLLSSSTKGWQNSLNSIHLVPDDALIFDFCRQGNLLAVRKLLSERLASVRDTDSKGYTPLHVSNYGHTQCEIYLKYLEKLMDLTIVISTRQSITIHAFAKP